MKKIKSILALSILSMLMTSCSEKEELYSVQGTIINCETNEPIEGFNLEISENDNYYSFSNLNKKTKTDSLGQFILHLDSENSQVHVFFDIDEMGESNYLSCEGESITQKTVTGSGLTTIELGFKKKPDVSPFNIVFVDTNLSVSYDRVTAVILNPEVIDAGSTSIVIDLAYVSKWSIDPLKVYAGQFVKYEIQFQGTGYNGSYKILTDSVYVPFSTELFTDTIYY